MDKILLKIVFVGLMVSSSVFVFAQNNFFILQGKIVDAKNGLRLKDVEYSIPTLKLTATAKDGTFAIAVTPGKHFIQLIHPDFKIKMLEFNAIKDTTIVVELEPAMMSFMIDEVQVVDHYNNKVHEASIGVEKVKMRNLELIPNLGGEKDPLKAVYHLPGVQMSGEASSDLIVRGGLPSQNKFLFDNAQIFNTNHAYGLLSTFNPESFGSVDLYKGGFPARYSGGLSSIVQMNSKIIDYEKFSGSTTVGIISASLLLNVPVLKGKSGLLFSARRTYIDALIRPFQRNAAGLQSFNFHDVYLKYTHDLGSYGSLSVSGYFDRDMDYYRLYPKGGSATIDEERYKRNQFVQGQWDKEFREISNCFALNYSNYSDGSLYQNSLGEKETIETGIRSITLKDIVRYRFSDNLSIEMGVDLELQYLKGLTNEIKDFATDTILYGLRHKAAPYSGVFAEANYRRKAHEFTLGYRNSILWSRKSIKLMHEPRLVYKNQLNGRSAVQVAYSRMYQPVHQLFDPGMGNETNVYISSSKIGNPEFSDQISLGYFIDILEGNKQLNLSVESYVKKMQNIITYLDGYNSMELFLDQTVADKVTMGEGYSYGLEMMAQKQQGSFIGSMAYTLSYTKNRYDDINNNEYFFSPYDRRHDFSIVGSYKLNHKWDFSVQWQFQTGKPYSKPLFAYMAPQFDIGQASVITSENSSPYIPFYSFSKRNVHRMLPYHRLDISARYHTKNKLGDATWEFSIYNAYNRSNVDYYFVDIEWDMELSAYSPKLKYSSLLPIVPSISYTLKF